MKVAIPIFGSRVSPRFDCAQAFLLVTVDGGQATERQKLAASQWAPHERINKLVEQGASEVVCGGIDWWSAASLQTAGITVRHGVSGEVDHALAALVRGELSSASVTRPTELPGRLGLSEGDRPSPASGSGPSPLPPAGRMRRCRRRGSRHTG